MSSIREMFRILSTRVPVATASSVPPLLHEPYGSKSVAILIPGYLYKKPLMHPLAKRLRRAGYQTDLIEDAVYERCSFEEQQRRLMKVVCLRLRGVQPSKIIIIGHSIGGLHAYKLAAQLLDLNMYRSTITVVALGSPFQRKSKSLLQDRYLQIGLALHGAASLLMPKGALFYELHTRLRAITFAARYDEVVAQRTAMLPNHWDHHVFETNHTGLIFKKTVFDHLLKLIQSS